MFCSCAVGKVVNNDVYEDVQRVSNARKLRASRSTKKHGRIECIFFSPSKLRRVLRLSWHCPSTKLVLEIILQLAKE